MKVICQHCGKKVSSYDKSCPHCRTEYNIGLTEYRTADGTYIKRGMQLLKTYPLKRRMIRIRTEDEK